MKSVLANLGFVLQIAGFFVLIPIFMAFYFNEIDALIPLFITAIALFSTGFLLNALCVRKELTFKSSCLLLSLVFILLSLFTSIPCQYLNPLHDSDPFHRFTNCYFESVSASTTTGFSLLKNVESLPKSIVFYRTLIEWVGGLGLIFILLTFFYPSRSVDHFKKIMGMEKISKDIKKSFIKVLIIYSILAGIFIGIFYFLGFGDLLHTSSLILSTLVTSSPYAEISPSDSSFNILLMIVMIIGATNFWVLYRLFTGNFKKALVKEFILFLVIIFFFSGLVYVISNTDLITSFFHVISASSTTGFSYVDFQRMTSPKLSHTIKLIFISLMFVGGCSFSTAGGIKLKRIILLFKSVPWAVRREITKREDGFVYEGRFLKSADIVLHLLVIVLGILLVLISAFVFTLYGFSLEDSLFESISAFSTSGITLGLTSTSLPLLLKWILIALMIIGRVEIFPFLIALSKLKEATSPPNERG